jgi:hypothetical protein
MRQFAGDSLLSTPMLKTAQQLKRLVKYDKKFYQNILTPCNCCWYCLLRPWGSQIELARKIIRNNCTEKVLTPWMSHTAHFSLMSCGFWANLSSRIQLILYVRTQVYSVAQMHLNENILFYQPECPSFKLFYYVGQFLKRHNNVVTYAVNMEDPF